MKYNIGDFNVIWTPKGVEISEDRMSALFRTDSGDGAFSYREEILDPALLKDCPILQKKGGHELLRTPKGLFFLCHWRSCRYAYGFYVQDLEGDTPVYFHPDMMDQPPVNMSKFLSSVGLHRKLLRQDAPVLHASYIDYRGEGILFLGPSGTGKSTQAALWNKTVGAEILNGDRVLLRERQDGWYCYGYPCCGSSNICVNRTLPLKAIVLLRQAAENQVEELRSSQKIRGVAPAMELYPWEPWEVERTLQLTERLITGVPVLGLSCRADREAVELLKTYLERGL